ncbi:MAG TPA: diaminopimelate epimerase [Acidimicrobiia bacterium]|nr:diaminopimelate epimerase [Acidimicrobiia bacterium]
MTTLHFSKLHATGNDFLVLVDLEARLGSRGRNRLAPGLRAALCDRRRGVGADGLIRLLGGSDGADCEMELTNADGGPAEISGNGLRCLAHVAAKLGLGADDRLVVDTAAGRREMTIRRRAEDGEVDYAEADMGLVMFTPEMIPLRAGSPFDLEATVDGVTYRGDAAGVGNPHYVIFVDDPDAVPLDRHGPPLEHDPRFPNRTNVEMAVPTANGLRMRIWERGVGETASCGSGACAAAGVAHRRGLGPARMTVSVPGGDLVVDLAPAGAGESLSVRLGGPVAFVYEVDVELDRLADTVPLAGGVL